ncbi:MAG: hypothetical protein HY393_04025 [Candidatus Diapherotrites archaeon]|nr:hypothetical protein [Candidatus Diapherotrites archaeon]
MRVPLYRKIKHAKKRAMLFSLRTKRALVSAKRPSNAQMDRLVEEDLNVYHSTAEAAAQKELSPAERQRLKNNLNRILTRIDEKILWTAAERASRVVLLPLRKRKRAMEILQEFDALEDRLLARSLIEKAQKDLTDELVYTLGKPLTHVFVHTFNHLRKAMLRHVEKRIKQHERQHSKVEKLIETLRKQPPRRNP